MVQGRRIERSFVVAQRARDMFCVITTTQARDCAVATTIGSTVWFALTRWRYYSIPSWQTPKLACSIDVHALTELTNGDQQGSQEINLCLFLRSQKSFKFVVSRNARYSWLSQSAFQFLDEGLKMRKTYNARKCIIVGMFICRNDKNQSENHHNKSAFLQTSTVEGYDPWSLC